MSLVFNGVYSVINGGGGGPSATDAILTVSVPTGSTVTMSKGGVTLTPTMWVQAADNNLDFALFVIPPNLFDSQNAWTVTATLVTDSASDTVTIDAAAEYELALSYGVYLFNNGNQYVAITGGWANGPLAASTYTSVPVTISASINYSYSSDHQQSMAITNNKITLYNGDIIRVKCSFTGKFSINVVSANATGWYASYKLAEYVSFTASETIHELPIPSNMQGYVLIGAFGQQVAPSGSGSITQVLIVR
jgi:hypothetical protein